MDLHEVQQAVERAAQAVVTLPPEQWAGWVCYLLEALDDQANDDTFLRDLQGDVGERLDAGRW